MTSRWSRRSWSCRARMMLRWKAIAAGSPPESVSPIRPVGGVGVGKVEGLWADRALWRFVTVEQVAYEFWGWRCGRRR